MVNQECLPRDLMIDRIILQQRGVWRHEEEDGVVELSLSLIKQKSHKQSSSSLWGLGSCPEITCSSVTRVDASSHFNLCRKNLLSCMSSHDVSCKLQLNGFLSLPLALWIFLFHFFLFFFKIPPVMDAWGHNLFSLNRGL